MGVGDLKHGCGDVLQSRGGGIVATTIVDVVSLSSREFLEGILVDLFREFLEFIVKKCGNRY